MLDLIPWFLEKMTKGFKEREINLNEYVKFSVPNKL